ncbi:prenyltransferase [candidate division KSB1 bacterium]|nr:prenyltransferase [candidate division KSB1 bacterium]
MRIQPGRVTVWWQAFRYHFVPPSFLPAILGSVIAWALTGTFHLWFFIATAIGVTLNHIALNMTDDYFDYKNSVDRAKNREKNPYSGGSGTLTSGLIAPAQMALAFKVGYTLTILIGLFLSAVRGFPVLAIGIFGMGSAYYYTAPPIRYGYRGWGELSQLINFSLTIGMGAFWVQSQTFAAEPCLALLPLGFMMFAMITINEIPDETDDREGGKRTLVVILGAEKAIWLYGLSMLLAYLTIIFSAALKMTSVWTLAGAFTLPWFIKTFLLLRRFYRNPRKMAPANLLTIRIHNTTGLLLIVAYLVQGAMKAAGIYKMVLPMVFLAILYIPAALPVFFTKNKSGGNAEYEIASHDRHPDHVHAPQIKSVEGR